MDTGGKKTGVEKVQTHARQAGVPKARQKNQIQKKATARSLSAHLGGGETVLTTHGDYHKTQQHTRNEKSGDDHKYPD